MKIERGKHVNWRELSFRICNRQYGISRDEYFVELNLWFWFITVTIRGKNKFKKFTKKEDEIPEFTKEDFDRMERILKKYTTVCASGFIDNDVGENNEDKF